MRIDLFRPDFRVARIPRTVHPCDRACPARPYFLHRVHLRPSGKGAIPFSSYLEKHNREDHDDLSRTALPLFGHPDSRGVGGTIDAYA